MITSSPFLTHHKGTIYYAAFHELRSDCEVMTTNKLWRKMSTEIKSKLDFGENINENLHHIPL